MEVSFCTSCGQQSQPNDRFCRGCGTGLSDELRAGGPIAEAVLLADQGHLDEAIATVQRAIGEDPRPDLYVALSTLYLRRGDVSLAERELDRAIAIEPDYGVAYAYKAGVCLQRGDVDDAQDLLDRALALAPNDLLVRIKRAEFWLRLGALPNAREELRIGLANGGGTPSARAIGHAMIANVDRQMKGAAVRTTVPLPSIEPVRRLFRRKSRPTGVEVEP